VGVALGAILPPLFVDFGVPSTYILQAVLYGSVAKSVKTWANVKLRAWKKIAKRPKNC
ncbi:unnamed protein product, partial [marine sediment metagenome]